MNPYEKALLITSITASIIVGTLLFLAVNANQLDGPVKTVTLSSASLYTGMSATRSVGATSNIMFALYNPGSPTWISSFTLTGTTIQTISTWDNTSATSSVSNLVVFTSNHPGNNALTTGTITFTYYPETTAQKSISAGQTFDYVITFANGWSISGSLIAQ